MKQLTSITNLLGIFMIAFILNACQKDLPTSEESLTRVSDTNAPGLVSSAARVAVSTVCFAAIAVLPVNCNGGEDILFGGKIEIRENITVSGNGTTHRSRHFTAKDMTGRSIPKGAKVVSPGTSDENCEDRTTDPMPSPTAPYKSYTVVGGAEMFSIHYGPGNSPTPASASVFIHQGTLVFVNDADHNDRIVARHTIISTPGGQTINQWTCGGN